MSRPLQNRVQPDGTLVATPIRGGMLGNRGGRIHNQAQQIVRRWASRQWICCVLEFKNRRREVMGNSYTELFFLDEATAFAVGHRPCFECRRKDAMRFAELWAQVRGEHTRARAPDMDNTLHQERLGPREQMDYQHLPLGTIFRDAGPNGEQFMAKTMRGPMRWNFDGYAPAKLPTGTVEILTPQSIRAVMIAGYKPAMHPSAH